jgi:uncharacterized membrane protein
MPRIELNLDIDAPVETVYEIARRVEEFPTFMNDLQSLTVLERSPDGNRTVTEWVGQVREFRMTIKWVQEDIWDPEQKRDDFHLIRGDMDAMSGYWQFSAAPNGTRFSSVLDYEYNVPLIGPMIKALIQKKLTENLASQMKAIKARAESGSQQPNPTS